jgi:hypothetical protein
MAPRRRPFAGAAGSSGAVDSQQQQQQQQQQQHDEQQQQEQQSSRRAHSCGVIDVTRRSVVLIAPVAAALAVAAGPARAAGEMPDPEDSCRECAGIGIINCEPWARFLRGLEPP